jgi:hypothetical protein
MNYSKRQINFIISEHWYFAGGQFLGSVIIEDLKNNIQHEYYFNPANGGESNATKVSLAMLYIHTNIDVQRFSDLRGYSICGRSFKKDITQKQFNQEAKRYKDFAGYDTNTIE